MIKRIGIMRIFLVVVILALLFLLIRQQFGLQFSGEDLDPILLGYGALFGAGIIAAEILRPLLKFVSGPVRFVVVVLVVALGSWGYSTLVPNYRGANAPSHATGPAFTQGIDIPLDWDGLYRATAQIDGKDVEAVIDTGASLVILTFQDAEQLGYSTETLNFFQPAKIAGTRLKLAPVIFKSVRLGDVVIDSVSGAIAENGSLDTNLIGVSFLKRLGEARVHGDVLSLRR